VLDRLNQVLGSGLGTNSITTEPTIENKGIEMNLVSIWEKKMKKAGNQFAMIRTKTAIYDRVAIVENTTTALKIQWPKGTSKKRNLNTADCRHESFTIKQEVITKTDIKDIRYYKD